MGDMPFQIALAFVQAVRPIGDILHHFRVRLISINVG